jgi:hypothetical protein
MVNHVCLPFTATEVRVSRDHPGRIFDRCLRQLLGFTRFAFEPTLPPSVYLAARSATLADDLLTAKRRAFALQPID